MNIYIYLKLLQSSLLMSECDIYETEKGQDEHLILFISINAIFVS